MHDFKVGDRVKIPALNATGKIAFIGETHFSVGLWFGVVLDNDDGRCDGSVDGIRYFKSSKDRGIFVRARLMEKDYTDANDCGNEQLNTSDTIEIDPGHVKSPFIVRKNNFDASKDRVLLKMQDYNAMNKHISNANEKKFNLPRRTGGIKKNDDDATYVVQNSSSKNRIKYPNYLKASSKLSSNHICEAKYTTSDKTKYQLKRNNPGICNNKSVSNKTNHSESLMLDIIKKETKELKDKMKISGESQQEILTRIEKIEEEITFLKKEIDCKREQVNFEEYQSKLLQMGYLDLYQINKSFINVFDHKLCPSNDKPDLKSINAMISRQKAALREQNEKTLQGLFEIKEFLNGNCKSKIAKTNFFSPSSRYPLKAKENNTCSVFSEGVVIKNRAFTKEVLTFKSKENIEILPETT